MRKPISVFLTLCLFLSLFSVLVACNSETGAGTHEHTWNAGEITTAATADAEGVKTFTCTVCGATKTEPVAYMPKATVTEDEWKTAFTFAYPTYECEGKMVGKGQSAYILIRVLPDKIQHIDKASDRMAIDYVEKTEGGYYLYDDETEALDENAERAYTKMFIADEEQFENNKKGPGYMTVYFVDLFASFTYDEENGCYTAAEVSDGSNFSASDVTVVMADGKIASLSFAMEDASYEFTMRYDNITITLPTNVTSD